MEFLIIVGLWLSLAGWLFVWDYLSPRWQEFLAALMFAILLTLAGYVLLRTRT
jgi:hypothetical protein